MCARFWRPPEFHFLEHCQNFLFWNTGGTIVARQLTFTYEIRVTTDATNQVQACCKKYIRFKPR